jgi:hypothetical protein
MTGSALRTPDWNIRLTALLVIRSSVLFAVDASHWQLLARTKVMAMVSCASNGPTAQITDAAPVVLRMKSKDHRGVRRICLVEPTFHGFFMASIAWSTVCL